MRILQLHSDFIEFEPIEKEISQAEETERKKYRLEDILVLFTAVEDGDDDSVGVNAINEVKDFLKNLKANKILIYPFAHLSNKLAKPNNALEVIKAMESHAKKLGIETHRAPFGWNKALQIKVKGHPLAEQSKVFLPSKDVERKEGSLKKGVITKGNKFHRFIIVDIDGKDYEITSKDWKNCKVFNKKEDLYELLKIFIRNEIEGKPLKQEHPKHIEYMRKLELVDYCPESDVGNIKWYPNGVLIKDLLMDYALKETALRLGAMKIQNPLIYRTDVEEIKKLQGEFHERNYLLEDDEQLVLRFASDPGAFPFAQKMTFSYKSMPVMIYEEAICFRKEQKGELAGLMRLRNFWMTDQHVFCQNEEEARQSYEELSCLFAKLMNEIIAKGHWIIGFEIVEEFYERYKDFLKKLIKKIKVPAFFKLMKEMTHYYAFKNEFQAIFPDGNNIQESTVQWDIKNGERFQICYTDRNGVKVPVPIILHASSFGSIERALAAILESVAWREKEGKPPVLPFWLSPYQVRIIPVSKEYLEFGKKVLKEIEKENIRVDIDDTDSTVSKKVLKAETDWVNYVLVVGEKENKSGIFQVRIRKTGEQKGMKLNDFVEFVKGKLKDKPFRPLYVPKELSKRPLFVSKF